MFGLNDDAQSLFLMGIFSVLDAMLELPMKDALKMVLVSSDIAEALTEHSGKFGDLYKFIIDYESADWNSVSRAMIIKDLNTSDVYNAYISALCWYRDMLQVEVEGVEEESE
jgi:EAL and modified HD-GYP domain-containing signal transduction protein